MPTLGWYDINLSPRRCGVNFSSFSQVQLKHQILKEHEELNYLHAPLFLNSLLMKEKEGLSSRELQLAVQPICIQAVRWHSFIMLVCKASMTRNSHGYCSVSSTERSYSISFPGLSGIFLVVKHYTVSIYTYDLICVSFSICIILHL